MELKQFENIGRELRDSVLRLLRDYSEALALAVLVAVILRLFVFAAFRISMPTMEPTVKIGDFLVGYKLPYGIQIPLTDKKIGVTNPKRWELVLFRCPNRPNQMCLRRVVGVSGDRIELRKKRLVINGRYASYTKSSQEPSKSLIAPVAFISLDEKWGDHDHAVLISAEDSGGDFGPFIVPPGAFFAMSDNRDFSEDSRHWGAIPSKSIEARALFVWLSIEWQREADGFDSRIRWSRLFQVLD